MNERTILHVDANNFYASVECMLHPELRGYPIAVCGDVEERHGIVLAKNYAAKAYGVSTGEAIWQAKQKCKDLIIVPPHYDDYMKISKAARDIYCDYTDKVEPFGMDECWLQLWGKKYDEKDGINTANAIRDRIKVELGITVSVGVSFNKVFAKLGSDLKNNMATSGKIIVSGEISCELRPYIDSEVKKALQLCGYSPDDFLIFVNCHRQSRNIANGVSSSLEKRNGSEDRYSSLGAGDQGTVYGYATNETEEMLPLPLVLAHNICREIDIQKRKYRLRGVMPDGKAQVTVEYEDGKAKRIKTIVVSVQHSKKKPFEELENEIRNEVLPIALSVFPADEDTEILINPAGCFNIGGPEGDTGLTGRKIMVDTYGGLVAHGGGAFSGKDATKVDRSGAYMARYIAKNIVKAGLAERCQVGISYAIGKAEPIAVSVDSFGTSSITDEELAEIVTKVFDLRPAAIIDRLDLSMPIYKKTSAYGHFNSPDFPWEKTDAVPELMKVAI